MDVLCYNLNGFYYVPREYFVGTKKFITINKKISKRKTIPIIFVIAHLSRHLDKIGKLTRN